ncbi:serine/threonine-protein kinase HAL4/sat4 [Entomortierella chlamydospora]|uniref:non-specific serine/threonine protein kinase n=1 Tax=Entomortierella chlamydospora TaxID=101097 RepID=A0A9P6SYG1_9FUNG|nr:serine/threonine-protein kinase HAL4/sat4 [Entomortierella chlamydospora]
MYRVEKHRSLRHCNLDSSISKGEPGILGVTRRGLVYTRISKTIDLVRDQPGQEEGVAVSNSISFKPENILLDVTGRILKIIDFGIASVSKSVGDPIPLPYSGIIGSEPYIAPEEFYQGEYDSRAVDVWACGIIFYVMFYSAMPWARADCKKNARFVRYINDIMAHRYSEPQRRLQYKRQLRNNSIGSCSLISQGSLSFASEAFNRPHEVLHQRQLPSYQPTDCSSSNSSKSPSSRSGSLCNPHGIGET